MALDRAVCWVLTAELWGVASALDLIKIAAVEDRAAV
jgi:hypothetical protein